MQKHFPIETEDTLFLDVGTGVNKKTTPVTSMSPDIQIEIKILDNIRQKVSNKYHEYNEMKLAYIAQQNIIHILLGEKSSDIVDDNK